MTRIGVAGAVFIFAPLIKKVIKKDSNGCGAKGAIRPPYHLFFRASCHKHDQLYDKGGTNIDRWLADLTFYNLMRYDVKKAQFKWIKKQYYLLWCKIYFISVRLFGAKYFNYHPINKKL